MEEEIIDSFEKVTQRRRKLLPWWMKVFIWLFGIAGLIVPIAFIFGILRFEFNTAMYGLETNNPLTWLGIFILLIFLHKGFVAFGLWFEKSWAPKLALADAGLGIVICMMVMGMQLFDSGSSFSFRLELVLIIPYLIKLIKIEEPWSQLKE